MTLKVIVLLVAVAFFAYRIRPRWRLPWMVPLVLVGVILTLRTITYLAGD